MEPLEINVRETDDGLPVVDVRGELDIATSPRLKTVIRELIDAGHSTLLINLRDAHYVDSSGLGVLVSGHKGLREKNGTIAIVSPPGNVRRVLEITRLHLVFPVFSTEEQALAAIPLGVEEAAAG